ncbi:18167_t:CDS:2, partial [Dentiscutata erythropus]
RSSPDPYTQSLGEQDTSMANIDVVNIDLFILINQGLDRLENHHRGVGTPLNNPINIINGIRDDRNNQILRLQQDINRYRQLDTLQQNHINQLTQDGITLQNNANHLTQELNNCRQKYNLRGHMWRNASLVWDDQFKIKCALEIIYK